MRNGNAVKVPVYAVVKEGNTVSKKRCVRLNARTVPGKEPYIFQIKG